MTKALRLAVVGIALAAATSMAADTPQQIVDQRVAAMKQMGGKIGDASQASDTAAARALLAEALTIAESIPSRFPAGTADGDLGVKTRALPKIWSDATGFKKAADGLVAALKLADAKLAANDAEGARAAFKEVRGSCGTCHNDYRGPAK